MKHAQGAGAALAAVVLAVLAGGCGSPAPSPPDLHDRDAVLAGWLAALARGDCAAARSLETDRFAGAEAGLCGAIGAFQTPTDPAMPNPGEAVYGTRITLTRGLDGGLPPGPMTWFTTLRHQADGSWRVDGGGTGP